MNVRACLRAGSFFARPSRPGHCRFLWKRRHAPTRRAWTSHPSFIDSCPQPHSSILGNFPLAQNAEIWDNYYMARTTHRVADEKPMIGHFSDPPLLVLASLADGPKHGHAMLHEIEAMCGTRLGPGALYGAITRLEKKGFIEPLPVEDRRHPYRITSSGVHFLKGKLATMRHFANAGWKKVEAL